MNGTSINDLHNRSMETTSNEYNGDLNYGNMQDLQYQQSHNNSYNTSTHPPNYGNDNSSHGSYQNPSPSPILNIPEQTHDHSQRQNMVDLAKDISDNLPNLEQDSYVGVSEIVGDVDDELDVQNIITSETQNVSSINNLTSLSQNDLLGSSLSIPSEFKDPLLIVILFVILSQSQVRNTISKYVTIINPGPNGQIPQLGFVVYGAILASLFYLIKKNE
jgi:hypothetical protein